MRACGEYSSRAESVFIVEGFKKVIVEEIVYFGELDVVIECKKWCYVLLLKVIDDVSRA